MRQAAVWFAVALFARAQPDASAIRRLFEQNLARNRRQFGGADAHTAQAARDLALFLERSGDKAAARMAFRETVQMDDRALGLKAGQTLEDVSALAALSPTAAAAPLWMRATDSADPTIAGPALSSLAEIRKAHGDRTGAAALLRRAVEQAELADGRDGEIVALVLKALAAVAPPDEALKALQRVLQIDVKRGGLRDPHTVRDARELATLMRRLGHTAQAAAVEHEFAIVPVPGRQE